MYVILKIYNILYLYDFMYVFTTIYQCMRCELFNNKIGYVQQKTLMKSIVIG